MSNSYFCTSLDYLNLPLLAHACSHAEPLLCFPPQLHISMQILQVLQSWSLMVNFCFNLMFIPILVVVFILVGQH